MDPFSQELRLGEDGVYRDIGVSGGYTLVVVRIDRTGRRWPDTIRSICELRDREVKIRFLAEAEDQWTQYLN